MGPIPILVMVMLCAMQPADGKMPLHKKPEKYRIPGQYIVVLKDDVDVNSFASAFEASVLRGTSDGKIKHKYQRTIKGFSARLSSDTVDKLRKSKHVKYIEEDGIVHTLEVNSWGLGRVDQRGLPLDVNTPEYIGDGTNAHLYILDTGTLYTHEEFSGRTGNGADFIGDQVGFDCNGHGTHCGGTAGGTKYGIANKATIHSVRVLGCDGRSADSSVIKGMEWVAENKIAPAVASMSLGGGYSQSLNDAVKGMIDNGIIVSLAAGNEDGDACTVSPASAPEAITVGATDITDKRASFSNYGTCVDIFAPGVSITSSYIADPDSSNPNSISNTDTISGTSMACPHVSGAAAALLSVDGTLTPAQVTDQLLRASTVNQVTDPKLSPNRLLYIGKDTCMLRCNTAQDRSRNCQCDSGCDSRVDCCTDFELVCGANAPTCSNRCGETNPCPCDEACVSRGDCCPDYLPICKPLTTTPCDSTVSEQEGTITSPNHPSLYGNGLSCFTSITAPVGKVVALIFKTFEIEFDLACSYDGLSIYDGDNNNNDMLIDKYCGFESPSLITSTGQNMYLMLESDNSVSYPGYTADLYFVNAFQRTPCNAALTQEGSATSPNYPDGEYSNDLACNTVITAGQGQVIRLRFIVFSLEDDNICSYDSLSIYDGSDPNAYLIGKYCGDAIPELVESSGQSLFLEFKTDVSITYEGFYVDVDFIGDSKTMWKPTPIIPQKALDEPDFKTMWKPTPIIPQKVFDEPDAEKSMKPTPVVPQMSGDQGKNEENISEKGVAKSSN